MQSLVVILGQLEAMARPELTGFGDANETLEPALHHPYSVPGKTSICPLGALIGRRSLSRAEGIPVRTVPHVRSLFLLAILNRAMQRSGCGHRPTYVVWSIVLSTRHRRPQHL